MIIMNNNHNIDYKSSINYIRNNNVMILLTPIVMIIITIIALMMMMMMGMMKMVIIIMMMMIKAITWNQIKSTSFKEDHICCKPSNPRLKV